MKINKLTSEQFPGYTTYEIVDPDTVEGVWYLAINDSSKLVNIMALNQDAEINPVDSGILKFRTKIPMNINKDGILVMNDPDSIETLLVDLLGEHAAIVAEDMGIELGDAQKAAIAGDMNTEEIPDLTKYDGDPYAGLNPEVIDLLKNANTDSQVDNGSDDTDEFEAEPLSDEEDIPDEEIPDDEFPDEETGVPR